MTKNSTIAGAMRRGGGPTSMTLSDSVYERLLQQRIIVLGQEVEELAKDPFRTEVLPCERKRVALQLPPQLWLSNYPRDFFGKVTHIVRHEEGFTSSLLESFRATGRSHHGLAKRQRLDCLDFESGPESNRIDHHRGALIGALQ